MNIDELQETLLNICIRKLTTTTAAADGSRRRRTLRHTVLINNMLQSLENDSKPREVERQNQRARITARRQSSGTCSSATESDSLVSTTVEHSVVSEQQSQELSSSWQHQQSLEHPSSWKPHHQLELLPSPLDVDNSEVMSSPTATFCPLLAVDLTSVTSVSDIADTSQPTSELESLDISSYNADLNFFEQVPFYKTAALGSSFSMSDLYGITGVCDNNRTVEVTVNACDMIRCGLDPLSRVLVHCWISTVCGVFRECVLAPWPLPFAMRKNFSVLLVVNWKLAFNLSNLWVFSPE